ncbi:uncharacterized protein BT62DRAFT_1080517 [Guyanagaster necrorhizus]|uniref:Uncharacterized protein n=1 Tax=Guyanagaster necrorhizus TaxID=856835 RepID=A0A9P8AM26_9AGAR|nr:uncharacterized protein BT62DRAFT_1080517 [Guyanagaster necrorhizus MCA 3950]KAG7440838.1 hypothetical protein BT62DRAFT_1080517 [Guyanagaster necrorhizus MCA 3950]
MYRNLLAHLSRPTTSLPFETVQAALAHHLAHLSPLPAPLAATAVSSPLFLSHPLTLAKLDALSTAFRHALHIKFDLLKRDAEQRSAVFSRAVRTRLALWVDALIKGLQGGQPIMRLACSTGVILGINDVKLACQGLVENEVVLSLAEVMDLFKHDTFSLPSPSGAGEWEKEFQPQGDLDLLSIALILSSRSLPLISEEKLKALPLEILLQLLTSTISSAFLAGKFLSSPLPESPLMASIAPLSKLSSLAHSLLLDSRPKDGLMTAQATLMTLRELCAHVEADYRTCKQEPESIASAWSTLKTLLFSTIMIAESVLSSIIYVPPTLTTTTIALTSLFALSHLAFVIQRFGGITASGNGFKELKQTVYLALDIIASQGDGEGERFVYELRDRNTKSQDTEEFVLAKKAFVLACVEQLIPVLSPECIERDVWSLCEPHLSAPSHRETYESAHSVVLAMLSNNKNVVERMVPFYTECLIDNSGDGGLDTHQLCLAFSTLVRCACESGDSALGWFPVDSLIREIEGTRTDEKKGKRLRLGLISCVSAVRGVPMLERILVEVRRVLGGSKGKSTGPPVSASDRMEEVERLAEEIVHRVGGVDGEKEFVIRWWSEHRATLAGDREDTESARL